MNKVTLYLGCGIIISGILALISAWHRNVELVNFFIILEWVFLFLMLISHKFYGNRK